MLRLKSRALWLGVLILLVLGVTVSAQNDTLSAAQPVNADLPVDGELTFEYVLGQTSQVSLQAISAKVQPILTILRDGNVIATQPNPSGTLTITLNALLTAGTYQVRVQGGNGTSGAVILLVESETPIAMAEIGLDTLVSETLDTQVPLAFYRFGNLPEAAYLYIDSELPDGGLLVFISEEAGGGVVGSLGTAVTGGRFTLPAGATTYIVQVNRAKGVDSVPFRLCLTAVSARGCEFGGGSVISPATTPSGESTPIVSATQVMVCTVTPSNSGGANIRQSASTGSIIIGALPGTGIADVLGVSPDKSFFNIQYNATNGWVAISVVTTSGACDTLPTVQPPAIIAPSNTPTPTPIPATATPSGPCLIFINTPTFTYTTTIADTSHLFDQIQSGTVEAIGRTHDNAWWQTNYGDSWIQTNTFGNGVSTSGGCHNLPVVSP